MEFDEGRYALGVDEPEGVDAEPLDHAQRTRDRAVRHYPGEHVHTLRHQRREVPECIVRGRRLRIAAVRLHLYRMDEIGKLDRVLDEEHRDVVADEVEIAFFGVKLHCKAAHVTRHVARPRTSRYRGKPGEDLRLFRRILKERRFGVLC
jgi:hypothetical protein